MRKNFVTNLFVHYFWAIKLYMQQNTCNKVAKAVNFVSSLYLLMQQNILFQAVLSTLEHNREL